MNAEIRQTLNRGTVIPAHPLALNANPAMAAATMVTSAARRLPQTSTVNAPKGANSTTFCAMSDIDARWPSGDVKKWSGTFRSFCRALAIDGWKSNGRLVT